MCNNFIDFFIYIGFTCRGLNDICRIFLYEWLSNREITTANLTGVYTILRNKNLCIFNHFNVTVLILKFFFTQKEKGSKVLQQCPEFIDVFVAPDGLSRIPLQNHRWRDFQLNVVNSTLTRHRRRECTHNSAIGASLLM